MLDEYAKNLYKVYNINLKIIQTIFDFGYVNLYTAIEPLVQEKSSKELQESILKHGIHIPYIVNESEKDVFTLQINSKQLDAVSMLNKRGYLLTDEILYINTSIVKPFKTIRFITEDSFKEIDLDNVNDVIAHFTSYTSTMLNHIDELIYNGIQPIQYIKREIDLNSFNQEKSNIIISKLRNKANPQKVKNKFGYDWTDTQVRTWELMKLLSPRVNIDNKTYFLTLMNTVGLYYNEDNTLKIELVKDIFKYFGELLESMKMILDYEYIDFNEKIDMCFDSITHLTFNGFPFTLTSLKDSISKNGVFFPMSAYKNREDGKYLFCGGRHKLECMRELVTEDRANHEILCYFWDSFKEFDSITITVPTIITRSMLKLLDVNIVETDEYFSQITLTTHNDFWIISRAFEKEVEFLLQRHIKDIMGSNINIPTHIVNRKIN